MQNNIQYLLYTFYNVIVLWLKVQKIQLFYAFFPKKTQKKTLIQFDRVAIVAIVSLRSVLI